jgi:CRISPR-associated exonuclease Cas4
VIWVAVGLLVFGVALLLRGRSVRQTTGLPWRQVVYQDTQRRELSRPLFSQQYRLTGQPDYVLTQGAALIPVEVKPTRRDREPRQGDILQLAAYCLLIEEWSGTPPPYGVLRYAETTFEIPWNDALYTELLDVLDAMRADLDTDDVPRSHDDQWRCAACGFADRCTDRL